MNTMLQGVSLTALLFAAAPFVAPQAAAQDDAFNTEQIFVTARNRAESLQDVPLSISAFSAEDIQRRGLQELDDVARFTSGFSFEDFSGGFATPTIRGQAQSRVTALESNVSAFFDGIYLPRSWSVDLGVANLERIEVVKGPQSARYGRNAFSGAINYLPQTASLGDIAASAIGTIGSDERYDAGAFLNIPVTERLAVAGSLNWSTFDGTWGNDHPFADADLGLERGTQGNIGGWDNMSYSLSVLFEPTDFIRIEASYNRFEIEQEARASNYLSEVTGDTNCGSRRSPFDPESALTLICGEFPNPGDTTINDPRGFGNHSTTDIWRVNIEIDLSDTLTFTYLFGQVNGNIDIATSGEPDPIECGTVVGPPTFPALCNFQNTPIGGINYDSHEVRLDFDNDGQLRGAIGGFYSEGTDQNEFFSVSLLPITDVNNVQTLEQAYAGELTNFVDSFLFPLANEFTETEVISVFAEAQWTSAGGSLRIGAEGRYSETDISVLNRRSGQQFNDTFNVFTPRFTGEYDLTSDNLLYATIARGTKAGGFNASAIAEENQVFGPEFNWTYEIGTKNTFFDGAWTVNAAAYYTQWTEIQINSADPDALDPNSVSITQNLGNATLYGFELDTQYKVTSNLSIDANFSHVEGTYDDGTFDNRFSRSLSFTNPPCDDVVCNSNGDISGNDIERASPTQASAGVQWDAEIPQWDGSYFLRADASWQAKFFADSANTVVIPSRTLVNARAGINVGNFDVSIWARNLFDENYVSNAFVVLLPFGNTFGTFLGERRTFGITGSFRY